MSDKTKAPETKGKAKAQANKPNKLDMLLDLLIENEKAKHGEGARSTMLDGLKAIKNA